MKVKPLGDRVLVQVSDAEGETKGGIVLPDNAKEKPQSAKVVAVGQGRVNDEGKITPLEVKSGDTILFGKYTGTELAIDGEEYLMLKEEEILAVVN